MELRVISEKEFDLYQRSIKDAHFMQTSGFGDVSKKRNYIPHYLGFYDENKIVGSALLLEKKLPVYSTFYCPRGFNANYNDKNILKQIIFLLKEYVKKNKGLYFKINPDIIIRKLDDNANPTYIDEYNFSLIDFFKESGGKHRGFTTKFCESSAPRFTFRVDVSKSIDEIFSSFHNTTKKIIKENNPYNIQIEKNYPNALDDFYSVMKETSIRKKLYVEPFEYFKDFFELLHNKNEADVYVASVNIQDLKNILDNKIKDVDKEINELNNKTKNKKNENKLKDLELKRNKILKMKKEVDDLKEQRIILSSIITTKFGNKVWTIHGGNSDRLQFLNANYELYYHILLDAHNNGYQYVDFYGSEGKVNKNSPIYGIYLFKLRFGGDFDEFIGEFDFVIKPIMNSIINKVLKLRRRILYHRSLKQ